MHKLFSLRDSKGKKTYIASGQFRDLIHHLNFRLGKRNIADRAFVYFQSFMPKSIADDHRIVRIWTRLNSLFSEGISAAILFDTSWYKDTLYLGLIQSQKSRYFLKIYDRIEDAMFQQHQNNFVSNYFGKAFRVLPIIQSIDSLILWDFIERKRAVTAEDHIQNKILGHMSFLLDNCKQEKYVQDILPIDISTVFKQAQHEDWHLKITQWSESNNIILPIIPIHGDLTPWNIVIDRENNLTLIDYESAGWHCPYYDYFHYMLQPIALKKECHAIETKLFDIGVTYSKELLCVYLIDQLYQHLNALNNGFSDIPLQNLINNKSRWLMELMDGNQ